MSSSDDYDYDSDIELDDPLKALLHKFSKICPYNNEVIIDQSIAVDLHIEVEKLLNNGTDISVPDKEGRTLLMYLCRVSRALRMEKYVKRVLDKGVDVNVKDSDNWTALSYAICAYNWSSAETIRMLIAAGADINVETLETTMILNACNTHIHGYIGLHLLIAAGADVNAVDNDGDIPLHYVLSNLDETTSLETVRILLEHGADINKINGDGHAPLMLACTKSTEAVRILLDKKPQLELKDYNGNTALHWACEEAYCNSNNLIVEMLCIAGADVNAVNINGITPLMNCAFTAGDMPYIETAQILLQYGADIQSRDNKGWTVIMHACFSSAESDSTEMIDFLLAYEMENSNDNKNATNNKTNNKTLVVSI